jgi:hypothetical protein
MHTPMGCEHACIPKQPLQHSLEEVAGSLAWPQSERVMLSDLSLCSRVLHLSATYMWTPPCAYLCDGDFALQVK